MSATSLQDAFHRLENRKIKPKLKNIELYRKEINDNDIHTFSVLLKLNKTVKKVSLSRNHITFVGATSLAECISINSTLEYLYLSYNKIGNNGAIVIAQSLVRNSTLQRLHLANNEIGNMGAKALINSLYNNSTLTHLSFYRNLIDNDGAKEFSKLIVNNKSLYWLALNYNIFNYEGEITLLDALRRNSTIEDLKIYKSDGTNIIQQEINEITEWNRKCRIYGFSDYDMDFPFSYRDNIVNILLFLNELPLSNDMHWNIVNMLRVRYVVDYAKYFMINIFGKY